MKASRWKKENHRKIADIGKTTTTTNIVRMRASIRCRKQYETKPHFPWINYLQVFLVALAIVFFRNHLTEIHVQFRALEKMNWAKSGTISNYTHIYCVAICNTTHTQCTVQRPSGTINYLFSAAARIRLCDYYLLLFAVSKIVAHMFQFILAFAGRAVFFFFSPNRLKLNANTYIADKSIKHYNHLAHEIWVTPRTESMHFSIN